MCPWQTLLFPASAKATHYYLDLFWMPVVEPYAISQPFSTAGKINLNYQIMPFTNIKRATAILALTEAEYVKAVPNTAAQLYKKITNSPRRQSVSLKDKRSYPRRISSAFRPRPDFPERFGDLRSLDRPCRSEPVFDGGLLEESSIDW